jgi:hypothetical protein
MQELANNNNSNITLPFYCVQPQLRRGPDGNAAVCGKLHVSRATTSDFVTIPVSFPPVVNIIWRRFYVSSAQTVVKQRKAEAYTPISGTC